MVRNLFITTTILTCLSIVFFMSGFGGKKAIPEGTILAEYNYNGNKQFVTLEELEQEISELPKYKQSKHQDLEGKKEYLTLMIESRLILEMAKAQGLDKDPEILKQVEDTLQKLMVEKITELEVDEKVNVIEDDLKQYYEEKKEDYVEPEQVRMMCICLNNEELAEETFKQIKEEGKDILELAKTLSDDRRLVGPGSNARNPGDTGFFSRDVSESWKPFVDASFELEIGEMYPEIMKLEIQEQKYYLIFRKEEHKPERQQEFDEVRKKVERKVQRQKKKERMDEWINKIRTEANLKEYPDKIPAPPEEVEEKPAEEKVEEIKSGAEEEKSEEIAPSDTETPSERSEQTEKEKPAEEKVEETK